MKYLRNLLQKIILISAVITLWACGPSPKQSQLITQGIVYCSEGSPTTFNPQLTTVGTTIDATSYQLYNRLVEYNPSVGQLEPALATGWDITNDGKTYTFSLRENVPFHQT